MLSIHDYKRIAYHLDEGRPILPEEVRLLLNEVERLHKRIIGQQLSADLLNVATKKAQGERDVMREALKPFARPEFSQILGGNVQGDDSIVYGKIGVHLTIGDFRRAQLALEGKTETGGA